MSAHSPYFLLASLGASACMVMGCATSATPAAEASARVLDPVRWITPYRADVVQGNFISREQIAQLRAGMGRNDVRSVLGTPLLTSVFHADRWDYVFTLKRQGMADQAFRYSVFFKGEALERFDGDTMPSEAEFIARMDTRRKLDKVPALQATPEQLEAAAKAAPSPAVPAAKSPSAMQAASADQPALASYPPLESPRQ